MNQSTLISGTGAALFVTGCGYLKSVYNISTSRSKTVDDVINRMATTYFTVSAGVACLVVGTGLFTGAIVSKWAPEEGKEYAAITGLAVAVLTLSLMLKALT